MGAAGQRLGLRLFLEGIEVPVIAATVQIGINGPATSSIQVVPGDNILGLRARTMVHLFYWDFTLDNEPLEDAALDPEIVAEEHGISIEEAKELIATRPDEAMSTPELLGYKLLFTGEVIGVSLVKTPMGRQAVLQCSDFSTYWDTTYQFFASASNLFSTSAAVWAGGAAMFDDFSGHIQQMNSYLRRTPKTPGLQNVKGLMGGIISLLEAMGGVPGHMHGCNDFFAIGELKNHILQQLVCEQDDDTSLRLFDNKAFSDWLNRGMSSMGSMVTFRDMLRQLFQYVYYEVVPNPVAMYVPRKSPKTTEKTVSGREKPLPETIRTQLMAMRAASFINARVSEQLEFDETAVAKEAITQLDGILGNVEVPKSCKRYLEQAKLKLQQVQAIPVAFKPAPVSKPATQSVGPSKIFLDNRDLWSDVNKLLSKALGITPQAFRRKVIERQAVELDRLHTQIFRPDCFFAAPPRCNVIFPDQYTQLSYSRSFLSEVTRLRLHEAWEFGINEGILEQNIHFAPAMKIIKKLAKEQGNKSVRALLPWEIYSGILPKFETIHEINYAAGKSERRLGVVKGKTKGDVKDYAQRVANFNYLKYRFAARTCDVAAKFNPGLVCGFPSAVLTQPFILDPVADKPRIEIAMRLVNESRDKKLSADDLSDNIREVAIQLGAPSQYIGMIAGLGHSVDQGGGNTSIAMTHSRSHRITDDDFLGIFSKELAQEVQVSIRTTVLDGEATLSKGDRRQFQLLRDITDQGMEAKLPDLIEKRKNAPTEPAGGPDDPDLEERSSGMPDLSDVDSAAEFGSFLQQGPAERDFSLVPIGTPKSSPGYRVSFVGEVTEVRSKSGRQTIFTPAHAGKLKVGDKGPNGGKILQIQLYSDGGLIVLGSEINKKLPKTVKYVTEVYLNEDGQIEPYFYDEDGNPIGTNEPNFSQVNTKKVKRVSDKDKAYLWRKAVIYEEVNNKKTVTKILPIEEGLRPPWFSPLYSNWFIGEQIYEKFFGIGSVVDESLFVAPTGAASFGTGKSEQAAIMAKLKEAGNDRIKITAALEEAKAKNLGDVPDIESSIDALAYIYGEVRRLNLDVHRFVNDYTRRPIATMRDMLGSEDLQYEVDGKKLKLVQGVAGFHSTAIAPFGELLGLVDNPDAELPRLNSKGKREALNKSIDPRPGRREKVIAYRDEIGGGRGALGVGVQG